MSKTGKIVLGIGLASGALLAAWLLSGERRKKTLNVVSKTLKKSPTPKAASNDDPEINYI